MTGVQPRASATPSLGRGAALITIAAAVSRITGFLRVVVVAAAMGTTYLANTYQTANTAPNVVFELVAAGVLTSVFVPTFVDYIVRDEREEGWRVANVLSTVAFVALAAITLVVALGAPLIMRLLTIGVRDDLLREEEIAVGATFLRLFSPQIILYGAGMIMTGALHAHRRFALAAVAPIFNNVVVICVYLAYAALRGARPPTVPGITGGEELLLGAGTTAGVVAMTICLVPQLHRLGWRFRWRFLPSHPAVKRAARLGAWALGYAGGYQAGLVVVLVLANRVQGGVAAYQWAYTFFFVPHALFAVPLFSVLFPAMSRHVAEGEVGGFVARLDSGMGMMAFLLIPTAVFVLITAAPLARATLDYGVMSGAGANLVARVLVAFVVGLPTYSAFLALTRAYYALGDTRTPALVNGVGVIVASVAGVALFFWLPSRWSVAGLALGHSIGFAIGTVLLARLLSRRVADINVSALQRAGLRCSALGAGAWAIMLAVHAAIPEATRAQALGNVVATGIAGAGAYLVVMARTGSTEWARIRALLSGTRA